MRYGIIVGPPRCSLTCGTPQMQLVSTGPLVSSPLISSQGKEDRAAIIQQDRAVLQQDWAVLQQDWAVLQHVLQQDRAVIQQDRVVIQQEREAATQQAGGVSTPTLPLSSTRVAGPCAHLQPH